MPDELPDSIELLTVESEEMQAHQIILPLAHDQRIDLQIERFAAALVGETETESDLGLDLEPCAAPNAGAAR